jgi:hypothetical protein
MHKKKIGEVIKSEMTKQNQNLKRTGELAKMHPEALRTTIKNNKTSSTFLGRIMTALGLKIYAEDYKGNKTELDL